MSIGRKLLISFIVVCVISMVSGITALFFLNVTNNNYYAALQNYGFAQGDIGRFGMEVNSGRSIVRDIIFLKDDEEVNQAVQELQTITTKADEYMKLVGDSNVSDEAKQLFAEIEKQLLDYRVVRDQVVEYGLDNQNDLALNLFRSEGRPLIDRITGGIEQLMQLNSAAGLKEASKLEDLQNTATFIIFGVMLLSLTAAIILATVMSRKISRPVKAMAIVASKMAEGDLNVSIDTSSRDEIGQFAKSFQSTIGTLQGYNNEIASILGQISSGNLDVATEMDYRGDFVTIKESMDNIVLSLNNTFSEIQTSSEQVAGGADQVACGAQALSQGSTEQASAVEQLSATISRINDAVKQNAKYTDGAQAAAMHASAEVNLGNVKMQEMIAAMSEINQTSNQISKIIKTIDNIAFQTNILALNAAVEAARAGQAGKGFEVVAQEVRSLALKSADAAKETTELIEKSMIAVNNGTKIAGETADSLQSIVESAGQISDLIIRIAEASKIQENAIGQVTEGVDQISSVVQTNSATAEESAAASEELSGQAQMLQSQVTKFKLKGTKAGYYAMPKSVHHEIVPSIDLGIGDSLYNDKY